MSRSVSSTALQAVFAQETGQVFLVLIEISSTELATPIRVVNNTKDVVSNGDTYTAFPFYIDFPEDSEDVISTAKLTIDSVDRSIVYAVRSISDSPTVTISVILADSPDTVEMGPVDYTFSDILYDSQTVTGTLKLDSSLDMHIPKDSFKPALFPGIF